MTTNSKLCMVLKIHCMIAHILFAKQGYVSVPAMISGMELVQVQKAFAAARLAEETRANSGNGLASLNLVERAGDFLHLLTQPSLLEIVGELMPTRYEGLPQCVSLTAHTASHVGVGGRGWRRDYARPVKDLILYGPPVPPQHMADELKVFVAIRMSSIATPLVRFCFIKTWRPRFACQ